MRGGKIGLCKNPSPFTESIKWGVVEKKKIEIIGETYIVKKKGLLLLKMCSHTVYLKGGRSK